MAQEKVACRSCYGTGRQGGSICRTCSGAGFKNEYRLFKPGKPSFIRSILRVVVIGAFIILCLAYVLNIKSKIDSKTSAVPPHPSVEFKYTLPEAMRKGSAYLSLEKTDIPAPCRDDNNAALCGPVISEFNQGVYKIVKCSYYNNSTDKTLFYFFWYKLVPTNMVGMSKKDKKSSLRYLGDKAVEECPQSVEEARALSEKNGS